MRWLLVSDTYKRPAGEKVRPFTLLYFATAAVPSAKPETPLPLKSVKPLGAATRICWQPS
jgi:hypothetical protein